MAGEQVTAKVKVENFRPHSEEEDALVGISIGPDYADEANKAWAAATPHLQINMTVQGAVAEHFRMGRKFTLHFVPED